MTKPMNEAELAEYLGVSHKEAMDLLWDSGFRKRKNETKEKYIPRFVAYDASGVKTRREDGLETSEDKRNRLARTQRVYFISDGELVKIGVSVDPFSRLAELQVANGRPLVLLGDIPGGTKIERALHKRFARLRRGGEWFEAASSLLDYIQGTRD